MKKKKQLQKIYTRIRKSRTEKGYSQQFVADLLNISQNAYCKIENGQTRLLVSTLLAITEILEVKLCDILKGIK